jgi:hypothetical protein
MTRRRSPTLYSPIRPPHRRQTETWPLPSSWASINTVTQITGLTDAGKIVGFYINAAGKRQGFPAVPVPETSSSLGLGLLLLMECGALILRAYRRRASSAA